MIPPTRVITLELFGSSLTSIAVLRTGRSSVFVMLTPPTHSALRTYYLKGDADSKNSTDINFGIQSRGTQDSRRQQAEVLRR